MSSGLVPLSVVSAPWSQTETSRAEVAAIKALFVGKATDVQQAMFITWLERATGVTELEFRPSGERETAFAGGKRFVGLQFFNIAKNPIKDK